MSLTKQRLEALLDGTEQPRDAEEAAQVERWRRGEYDRPLPDVERVKDIFLENDRANARRVLGSAIADYNEAKMR